jgi:hypothetical protein
MSGASKKVIVGSTVVAGLVALVSILDLALGLPFGRQMTWDILFLLSAAAVIYMAYDAYQDLK